MRIARRSLLPPDEGLVHKFFRCHNREFLLQNQSVKKLYQDCVSEALNQDGLKGQVQLHAFCIMNNHVHQLVHYKGGLDLFSEYMRRSHSRFGQIFNRNMQRSGKVANERPKTPLIQNYEHAMRVHFYIEANPIRASIAKSPNDLVGFTYNSYRFYAHGIRDAATKDLVEPEWYLELGPTPKLRQRAYRELFRQYVNQQIRSFFNSLATFIGDQLWRLKMTTELKNRIQRAARPPPSSAYAS